MTACFRKQIAIISNNREEWAVTYYAANGRGAQVVPLYEAQTERDWRFIICNSDAKVLVVATSEIYDRTTPFLHSPDFPCLETIICLEEAPDERPSYRALLESVDGADIVPPVPLSPDDLTAIVYTSGSTGMPKGVCLSHRNIMSNVKGIG